MATASSAQREPSMEEILASIRRIIEDSDPGRKLPGDSAEFSQDLEPVRAQRPEAEVESFRAELRTSPEAKPFTLADVQARIKAEQLSMDAAGLSAAEVSSRADAQGAAASGPVDEAHIDKPHAADRQAAVSGGDTGGEGSASLVADWRRDIAAAGQRLDALPPASARQEPVVEFPADVELEAEDLTVASPSYAGTHTASSDAEADTDEPANRPAIVSEQTGRQVAAAFGELSEAFAARGRKSVDEMAEEMLRPMLQDWLDNNLPTLVEKLVREEIERVARGV